VVEGEGEGVMVCGWGLNAGKAVTVEEDEGNDEDGKAGTAVRDRADLSVCGTDTAVESRVEGEET
jgi:hypothetical protein